MAMLMCTSAGLALRAGLAHVAKACEEPVIIPAAVLRTEGARPTLLLAFDAQQHK